MCDNDLADMQLLSEIRVYCALLIFSVNMLGLLLQKMKNGNAVTNVFQKVLNKS